MEKRKTNHSADFFIEFFKNSSLLGTPFQSSRCLVKAVAQEVVGTNVVELGAGNGPITQGILNNPLQVNLSAFEINPKLLENLSKIKNPRLNIINQDAENFFESVPSFDCVVSGLPLTSLPREVTHRILTESKKAKKFIQYKYFPEKKLLRKYFNNVSVRVVWRNMPPALVYVCENKP